MLGDSEGSAVSVDICGSTLSALDLLSVKATRAALVAFVAEGCKSFMMLFWNL